MDRSSLYTLSLEGFIHSFFFRKEVSFILRLKGEHCFLLSSLREKFILIKQSILFNIFLFFMTVVLLCYQNQGCKVETGETRVGSILLSYKLYFFCQLAVFFFSQ
jgi:hypothetical protein